jgi:glycosyltransferase involved in cell wall biosynthesis
MTALLVYALNLYWLSARLVRDERLLPGRPTGPRPPTGLPWPSVTVQLPVYNEPLVVGRLIDACSDLDYPRRLLEIQVLDDSTDATSDIVAGRVASLHRRGVNIVHVRRDSRDWFKAGALANGLRFASGDFIAVFDADFVPEPDFLMKTLPHFSEPKVGLVQARWAHLNESHSQLTHIQAFGLDTHFAVEQRIRRLTGCFINFNGTAGVWRRTCIEESGGWSADTLTEDLDLSYRAQLAGWRLEYVNDVEVPAELPASMSAFRSQQFRWAKGSVQTALRLLPSLWTSDSEPRVKFEGTIHLTAHLVFPFVLLAGLLHAPLVLMKEAGMGPPEGYFAILGLGLFGLSGFFLAQLLAQRTLYPDWAKRLRLFPWFMAGTMGLSASNTGAVWQALRRRQSPFVRTPKVGSGNHMAAPHRVSDPKKRVPPVVWVELSVLAYSLIGLCAVIAAGQWAATPFQLLFVWGFGLVVWHSVSGFVMAPTAGNGWKRFDGVGCADYLAPGYSNPTSH